MKEEALRLAKLLETGAFSQKSLNLSIAMIRRLVEEVEKQK